MAALNDLINQVYELTNRPDMVNETTLAVKAATLKLHRKDNFFKDLFETSIVYATEDYTQSINYRLVVPQFRQLKYLRRFDIDNCSGKNIATTFFKLKTPQETVDEYNLQIPDVCYFAGDFLQVRSQCKTKYAQLGCYVNPIVATDATYKSWIAIDHPFAIIFDAVSKVQGLIGNKTSSDAYAAYYEEELAAMIMANIEGEGR